MFWKKKAKIVSSHTADSKPVLQEVNGTVILPPLLFLVNSHSLVLQSSCVIKHNYHGKYHRMALNNPDKSFITLAQGGKLNTAVIYFNILILEKAGLKLPW